MNSPNQPGIDVDSHFEYFAAYCRKQFAEPFRNTVKLCDWMDEHRCFAGAHRVLDVGCGMGQSLAYMSNRYPDCDFLGIDINPRLVEEGRATLSKMGRANVRLETGDGYQLDPGWRGVFDGIVSLQTLSWLPDYEAPLRQIVELRPKWVVLTSLFYAGDISARIEITDFTLKSAGQPYRRTFYNVYSILRVAQFLAAHGYSDFSFVPFTIDIDLPKPEGHVMGTYTLPVEGGTRIQVSGPVLMSWHFILARRDN